MFYIIGQSFVNVICAKRTSVAPHIEFKLKVFDNTMRFVIKRLSHIEHSLKTPLFKAILGFFSSFWKLSTKPVFTKQTKPKSDFDSGLRVVKKGYKLFHFHLSKYKKLSLRFYTFSNWFHLFNEIRKLKNGKQKGRRKDLETRG